MGHPVYTRVYCIRQKIKRQKIKRQKIKTQKNQKAEKSKGRKSKGRKSKGRKSIGRKSKGRKSKAENQKTAMNGNGFIRPVNQLSAALEIILFYAETSMQQKNERNSQCFISYFIFSSNSTQGLKLLFMGPGASVPHGPLFLPLKPLACFIRV